MKLSELGEFGLIGELERRGLAWGIEDDADPAIGLAELERICRAVSVPVVAIGGIDPSNAGDCIRAGAAGVAVIRAAADARAVVEAIDAAR